MIGVGIGYPIGTLTSGATSGANRGGTNPPTRPDPIPISSCGCLWVSGQYRIRSNGYLRAIGFGVER